MYKVAVNLKINEKSVSEYVVEVAVFCSERLSKNISVKLTKVRPNRCSEDGLYIARPKLNMIA